MSSSSASASLPESFQNLSLAGTGKIVLPPLPLMLSTAPWRPPPNCDQALEAFMASLQNPEQYSDVQCVPYQPTPISWYTIQLGTIEVPDETGHMWTFYITADVSEPRYG